MKVCIPQQLSLALLGIAITIVGVAIALVVQGEALRIQGSALVRKKAMGTARLGIWAVSAGVIWFGSGFTLAVWIIWDRRDLGSAFAAIIMLALFVVGAVCWARYRLRRVR